MTSLAINFEMFIYLFWTAQLASLIADKAFIAIFIEYPDFAYMFSFKSDAKLPNYTIINDHLIKLINSQQLSYRPIYNLGLVELETLKTYSETNLVNNFIRLFKSPV